MRANDNLRRDSSVVDARYPERRVAEHAVPADEDVSDRVFQGVADVAGLVAELGLDARKVAVERNLEIVPRSTYSATALADGDRIEIVTFIGGG